MRIILLSTIILLSASFWSAQEVKGTGINMNENAIACIEKPVMTEMPDSTFDSLAFAFLTASIVLIYLITVVLYRSLLTPVMVMFAILLLLIVTFLALALTMNDLTLFSIIGSIVLIDLVSINAVLLVNFAKQMKRKGTDTVKALIEAGKVRLRPVLMTAITMMLVMLFIALTSGNGAELKNIIAWGIIGGFTNAMALSLIVVPVVYLMFYRMASKLRRKPAIN